MASLSTAFRTIHNSVASQQTLLSHRKIVKSYVLSAPINWYNHRGKKQRLNRKFTNREENLDHDESIQPWVAYFEFWLSYGNTRNLLDDKQLLWEQNTPQEVYIKVQDINNSTDPYTRQNLAVIIVTEYYHHIRSELTEVTHSIQ